METTSIDNENGNAALLQRYQVRRVLFSESHVFCRVWVWTDWGAYTWWYQPAMHFISYLKSFSWFLGKYMNEARKIRQFIIPELANFQVCTAVTATRFYFNFILVEAVCQSSSGTSGTFRRSKSGSHSSVSLLWSNDNPSGPTATCYGSDGLSFEFYEEIASLVEAFQRNDEVLSWCYWWFSLWRTDRAILEADRALSFPSTLNKLYIL